MNEFPTSVGPGGEANSPLALETQRIKHSRRTCDTRCQPGTLAGMSVQRIYFVNRLVGENSHEHFHLIFD